MHAFKTRACWVMGVRSVVTFWANSEIHLRVTLGQSYNYWINIDERVTRWVSRGGGEGQEAAGQWMPEGN